jgi:hypothetical protein
MIKDHLIQLVSRLCRKMGRNLSPTYNNVNQKQMVGGQLLQIDRHHQMFSVYLRVETLQVIIKQVIQLKERKKL